MTGTRHTDWVVKREKNPGKAGEKREKSRRITPSAGEKTMWGKISGKIYPVECVSGGFFAPNIDFLYPEKKSTPISQK